MEKIGEVVSRRIESKEGLIYRIKGLYIAGV